ncbi:cutinase precursor [Ascodesmis nigricans]|uniref:cutinase n=1 Tax=Ascodesmis nigricans TaxID=341454 RepID=A0A4S2MMD2_9PEZI|nr:cutinase precursor [Ascodesmis nigricans]
MKFLTALTFLVAGALAAPTDLEARQIGGSDTSNDFLESGCKGYVMIYARASSESGNIGSSLGPDLRTRLRIRYPGNFAMQGIDYPAALADNFLPRGTTAQAISDTVNMITRVANDCPNAKIFAGGYSQGTAVIAAAVEDLPSAIRNRVNAIVLFGYTKNKQNNEGVPNYPSNKLKIYCNFGDLVCTGSLVITAAHFTYGSDVSNAVSFLASKV